MDGLAAANVVKYIGEDVRRKGLPFSLWGRLSLSGRECIGQERV